MRLTLLCIGKLKEEPERAIVSRYVTRFVQIGASLGFSALQVVEIAESRAASGDERKSAEADSLRKRLVSGAKVVAFDEGGRAMGSEGFAEILGRWKDGGTRDTAIVIGGPDGLDSEFLAKADLALSLGRLTLPHGLARAIIAEQLYRAATILARHPYHRA